MNDDAASMLRQWWSALPTMFPWMQPLTASGTAPGSTATAGEPDAFNALSFDRLLTQLFEAWQGLLRSGGTATEGLFSMAAQLESSFGHLRESLASATPTAASMGWPMSWPGWNAPLLFAAGSSSSSASSNPLQIGADRTWGAFADAFGLRPMREVQEAWLELAQAESERRTSQAAYVGLVIKACSDGTRGLTARLEKMHRAGEQVASFLGFVRLWAREADAALHAAMQSEQGVAAAARAVRASTRQRAALNRLVALTSKALNVPTRAELDDAYLEIQQLKRELRRLKKGARAKAEAKRPASKPRAGKSRA
jgi:hypothetical protein